MTPAEHTLAAVTALTRVRQAVDDLWLDLRPLVPSASQLDGMVHEIVVELASARDSLECVLEFHLRSVADDPQAMNVNNWPAADGGRPSKTAENVSEDDT